MCMLVLDLCSPPLLPLPYPSFDLTLSSVQAFWLCEGNTSHSVDDWLDLMGQLRASVTQPTSHFCGSYGDENGEEAGTEDHEVPEASLGSRWITGRRKKTTTTPLETAIDEAFAGNTNKLEACLLAGPLAQIIPSLPRLFNCPSLPASLTDLLTAKLPLDWLEESGWVWFQQTYQPLEPDCIPFFLQTPMGSYSPCTSEESSDQSNNPNLAKLLNELLTDVNFSIVAQARDWAWQVPINTASSSSSCRSRLADRTSYNRTHTYRPFLGYLLSRGIGYDFPEQGSLLHFLMLTRDVPISLLASLDKAKIKRTLHQPHSCVLPSPFELALTGGPGSFWLAWFLSEFGLAELVNTKECLPLIVRHKLAPSLWRCLASTQVPLPPDFNPLVFARPPVPFPGFLNSPALLCGLTDQLIGISLHYNFYGMEWQAVIHRLLAAG